MFTRSIGAGFMLPIKCSSFALWKWIFSSRCAEAFRRLVDRRWKASNNKSRQRTKPFAIDEPRRLWRNVAFAMTKSTEEEWNNKQHNDDIKRVVASFYGNERAIECLSAILRDLRFGEEGGKVKNIFALRDARFHMTSSSLDENFVKFSVDDICMSRLRLAGGRSPVMSSFPWDHPWWMVRWKLSCL